MRLVILAICLLALAGCQTTSPRDTLGGPILLIPDVGQGHGAALVEGDRAVLIDVGPADQDAMDVALRAQGVREIELVVLTHPDIDHVGGLDGLTLPMRGILRGAMSREDSGLMSIIEPRRSDTMPPRESNPCEGIFSSTIKRMMPNIISARPA